MVNSLEVKIGIERRQACMAGTLLKSFQLRQLFHECVMTLSTVHAAFAMQDVFGRCHEAQVDAPRLPANCTCNAAQCSGRLGGTVASSHESTTRIGEMQNVCRVRVGAFMFAFHRVVD